MPLGHSTEKTQRETERWHVRLCIRLLCCYLYLFCNHEMCPWSMYCCTAYLCCINCSWKCACLPALCCWRWIVWCMHISCFNCDVHSCFELWSALSQSIWIRRYISVTYSSSFCSSSYYYSARHSWSPSTTHWSTWYNRTGWMGVKHQVT